MLLPNRPSRVLKIVNSEPSPCRIARPSPGFGAHGRSAGSMSGSSQNTRSATGPNYAGVSRSPGGPRRARSVYSGGTDLRRVDLAVLCRSAAGGSLSAYLVDVQCGGLTHEVLQVFQRKGARSGIDHETFFYDH